MTLQAMQFLKRQVTTPCKLYIAHVHPLYINYCFMCFVSYSLSPAGPAWNLVFRSSLVSLVASLFASIIHHSALHLLLNVPACMICLCHVHNMTLMYY